MTVIAVRGKTVHRVMLQGGDGIMYNGSIKLINYVFDLKIIFNSTIRKSIKTASNKTLSFIAITSRG